KPEARSVDASPESLISPADARLLVYDLTQKEMLPVKGYWYTLFDLLLSQPLANEFADSWCFVYRLAPCDYHRFHYSDDGRQENVVRIPGVLHSVNPIALSAVNTLLAKNYREVTVMHTSHFGKVVQVEVGAMMVGRIVQVSYHAGDFKRGGEKGWFEFGGSTIVQLISKDAVRPDADLLEHSAKGLETLVRMGERLGTAK
ncbi:MAG: phosphatidylserine decarboxylase, partial [Bacteroidales bacterium]|nr:phosphatidylserine decarboxylase [Bacteroidales bacterium]